MSKHKTNKNKQKHSVATWQMATDTRGRTRAKNEQENVCVCVFSHTQAVECLQNTSVWHVNCTAIQVVLRLNENDSLQTTLYPKLCLVLAFESLTNPISSCLKMPTASEINRPC